jgi:hypothetical protein
MLPGGIKYYTPLEMATDPVYVWSMSHSHHHGHAHGHAHRVTAAAPTFSLLRLSVWQRLMGAAVFLGVLWLLVLRVMG